MNLTDVPGLSEGQAECLRRAGIDDPEALASIDPGEVDVPPYRRENLVLLKWRAHKFLEDVRGSAHERPGVEEQEEGAPRRAEERRETS